MHHTTRSFLCFAAIAAAISLNAPGARACPPTAKDAHFFGAFLGVPTVDLNLATGVQTVKFAGVGATNLMGDVLTRSEDEVYFPAPITDPVTGGVTQMDGTYKIIGDDGDSLVIWISSAPDQIQFDPTTGHMEFSGVFVVLRGTGHYRHATGSGILTGSADASPAGAPFVGADGMPHLTLKGEGRWAIWGTISGVTGGPCLKH